RAPRKANRQDHASSPQQLNDRTRRATYHRVMTNSEAMKSWRIVIISAILPVVEPLIAHLRELGHEPVAWLMARLSKEFYERPLPPWGVITDQNAPDGISLLFARDKHSVAPLLRGLEPDLVLCWGFSWKLP